MIWLHQMTAVYTIHLWKYVDPQTRFCNQLWIKSFQITLVYISCFIYIMKNNYNSYIVIMTLHDGMLSFSSTYD
jgi:hypothetical protein